MYVACYYVCNRVCHIVHCIVLLFTKHCQILAQVAVNQCVDNVDNITGKNMQCSLLISLSSVTSNTYLSFVRPVL